MDKAAEIALPIVGKAVALILILIAGSIASQIIVPFLEAFGPWLTNWIEIPGLSVFIVWGQAIAVIAAVAIRVGVGIRDVLMSNGGEGRVSIGEYLFKSVVSISLVGLMPTFCSMVIWFGKKMAVDVMGATSLSDLTFEFDADAAVTSILSMNISQSMMYFCYALLLLLAFGFVITIVYQLLKRQFQMLFISVAAPWVGIKAATENDSSTYWEYLQSLFGMCVIQWLQYLGMIVGLSMLSSTMGSQFNMMAPNLTTSTYMYMLVDLAAFGAALGIPALLGRWIFSAPGASTGNLLVGMLIRKAAATRTIRVPHSGR